MEGTQYPDGHMEGYEVRLDDETLTALDARRIAAALIAAADRIGVVDF